MQWQHSKIVEGEIQLHGSCNGKHQYENTCNWNQLSELINEGKSIPAVAGTLLDRNIVWNSSKKKFYVKLYSNIRRNSTEIRRHIWKGQL